MRRPVVKEEIVELMRQRQKQVTGSLKELEVFARKENIPIIPHETVAYFRFLMETIQPKNILEIGTAIGFSALLMAEHAPNAKITTIDRNPEIQYEWARIPHFYYNYYVYQYSTGFAAASALAEKIVHGSQEDRDRYIDYLKAGKSDYPLNVMRKAGVDMEKEDYLNDAFAVFERRLNEFEALVEKLGLA